jgi:hypothetical protein
LVLVFSAFYKQEIFGVFSKEIPVCLGWKLQREHKISGLKVLVFLLSCARVVRLTVVNQEIRLWSKKFGRKWLSLTLKLNLDGVKHHGGSCEPPIKS